MGSVRQNRWQAPFKVNRRFQSRKDSRRCVIGLGTADEVCAQVDAAVQAGYTRVKLKVKPDTVLACVEAVRKAHPDLIIMLDANQSFDESNLDILRKLDEFDIACIEEPYNPHSFLVMGTRTCLRACPTCRSTLKHRCA